MSLPDKLLMDVWTHDDADHRVEHLAASNPKLGARLERFALRFISEKGLTNEFADALEEIDARNVEAAAERLTP
ncbi:hypothetical protein OCH239_09190 [Roseivivax halodurans JCM 10272]|uniref:Uncharacterized protein n=1 Tax=Roseivivax halodurans JCM 10272 TaxID=1449350 RepID=X7ECH5_9RHOB|nr:hypothetical protein [Roseivivax halodurans]ETX13647.1 hypothetical protein OCH239_09190 [Roseivivax halodurans JCM 10272]